MIFFANIKESITYNSRSHVEEYQMIITIWLLSVDCYRKNLFEKKTVKINSFSHHMDCISFSPFDPKNPRVRTLNFRLGRVLIPRNITENFSLKVLKFGVFIYGYLNTVHFKGSCILMTFLNILGQEILKFNTTNLFWDTLVF